MSLPLLYIECPAYKTAASHNCKDVLLLHEKYLGVIRYKRRKEINALLIDNWKIGEVSDKEAKRKASWHEAAEKIQSIEVGSSKKLGYFWFGNRFQGRELRIKTPSATHAIWIRERQFEIVYQRLKGQYSDCVEMTGKNKFKIHIPLYKRLVLPWLLIWFFLFIYCSSLFEYIRFNPELLPVQPITAALVIGTLLLSITIILGIKYLRFVAYWKLPERQQRRLWFEGFSRGGNSRPFRSMFLGTSLKIIGIQLIFIGANPITATLVLEALGFQSTSLLFATFIFMISGLHLIYYGYRLSLRKPKPKRDGVPIVLYLRSFEDEGNFEDNFDESRFWKVVLGLGTPEIFKVIFLGPIGNFHPLSLFRILVSRVRETSEEQLAAYLNTKEKLTFRGLGKPGELLAKGGADRTYVSHQDWQDQIIALIKESHFVVIQPSESTSIWWEIRQVFQLKENQEILFNLVHYRNSQEGYLKFISRLKSEFPDRINAHISEKLPNQFFLFFDNSGKARFLTSQYLPPLQWPWYGYSLDFKKTLRPFFVQLENSNHAQFHQIAYEPTKRYKAFLATIVWYIPMVVIFNLLVLLYSAFILHFCATNFY